MRAHRVNCREIRTHPRLADGSSETLTIQFTDDIAVELDASSVDRLHHLTHVWLRERDEQFQRDLLQEAKHLFKR